MWSSPNGGPQDLRESPFKLPLGSGLGSIATFAEVFHRIFIKDVMGKSLDFRSRFGVTTCSDGFIELC